MLEALFFYLLPGSVLLGLIPAIIAYKKGQSFIAWWGFGTLLFILALPFALLLQREPKADSDKTCSYCGAWVPQERETCPACHFRNYDPTLDHAVSTKDSKTAETFSVHSVESVYSEHAIWA